MKPYNVIPPAKVLARASDQKPVEKPKETDFLECLYGTHRAEVLHKGTAYCRKCYDEKNRLGLLVTP